LTEQRYRGVLQVQAGVPAVEVADLFGVSRQAVHRWLARYRDSGLEGLADRSRRPHGHPEHTSAEVEAAICELRRAHPRWGQRRIEFELGRNGCPGPVPSLPTIYRVLVRHQLIDPVPRKRRRKDYKRWQRDAPMQLWQMDIVDGIECVDGTKGKLVTGVDDHSRFCVIAAVVPRATGRAVCLALAEAMRRYGMPSEVLTDNGKQFTARFGRGGGETMFDRICRENGITHLLTKPRSPTTTGKVERFHQSWQREMLNDHPPFESLAHAQAVIDAYVADYNANRPHQALGMHFPADRFQPRPADEFGLRLPPTLTGQPDPDNHDPDLDSDIDDDTDVPPQPPVPVAPLSLPPLLIEAPVESVNLPVEVDRMVPASGNLTVGGQQFWLGPQLGGITITLWADTTVVHLIRAGVRLKTVPSRLGIAQLRHLLATGGRPAGPPPLTTVPGQAVEVDRLVNANGTITVAGHQQPIGYHLAGRRVTVRLDGQVMQILDPGTRTLLRSLPNPVQPGQQIRDARPAGPPPVVPANPPPVQRRVSARGVIVIAGQKINVGSTHAGTVVTIHTHDNQLRVHLGDQVLTETARTATKPVARFKAHKPEPPRQTRRQPDKPPA
jgi:transposase InsO family protein